MSVPALCKKHFRQVANYFDREVALAYALDESACVICQKVIFVENARGYVRQRLESGDTYETWVPPALYTPHGSSAHRG